MAVSDMGTGRVHPVLGAVGVVSSALAGVAEVDPIFMRACDQVAALDELLVIEARVAELKARLLVWLEVAGVAASQGHRDVSLWLAQQSLAGVAGAQAEVRFARSLAAHPVTAEALREGRVSVAQARVVMAAVDALRVDLPSELVDDLAVLGQDGEGVAARAEAHLLKGGVAFYASGVEGVGAAGS